ncbi:hypothetical protein GS432_03445 [Rhodococcus hoagii]|nr:hypothetical protein [Prescottella equi]
MTSHGDEQFLTEVHTAAVAAPTTAAAPSIRRLRTGTPRAVVGSSVPAGPGASPTADGTWIRTHTVTAAATAANASHAARQRSSASKATAGDCDAQAGPRVTMVWIRSRCRGTTLSAIAWPSGGDATPVPTPAMVTPAASTTAVGAAAMSAVPAVAKEAAATATARAPKRGVPVVAATTPTQYEA